MHINAFIVSLELRPPRDCFNCASLPICHFGQEGQAGIIHKRTEIKFCARNEFTHRNFTLIMLESVTVGRKLF